jgi:hypothetical protein
LFVFDSGETGGRGSNVRLGVNDLFDATVDRRGFLSRGYVLEVRRSYTAPANVPPEGVISLTESFVEGVGIISHDYKF